MWARACILSLILALASADRVVRLTPETFEAAVTSGAAVFVKFFAPWCGHCTRLAPTWSGLSYKFKDREDVKIAALDCSEHREHDIMGYPGLRMYAPGLDAPVTYSGTRDLSALAEFVQEYIPEAVE